MSEILIISISYHSTKLSTHLDSLTNVKKLFDNTWLIVTDDTSQKVYDKLEPYLDKTLSDRIFIGKITKEHQGWHAKSVWEWLAANEKSDLI